jgi:DNA-binding transcriptional LysR family regulator|tara:strand:+ start:1970 stop:2905 length:936 start_codon:yes stop_codon:yes gene_type:complete
VSPLFKKTSAKVLKLHIPAFKYFLTVSETGSVRKAADILHVSASAISRQIINLEHSFGSKLLDRNPSGIQLTVEGKILESHMRKTIREMEIAKSRIDEISGILSGKVHYATIEGVAKDWLLPEINNFSKLHPGIEFSGRISGSDLVYESIRSGNIDFGVVMDNNLPQDIEVIRHFKTDLKVVTTAKNPISKLKYAELKDLENQKLTMLNDSFLTRKLVTTAANKLNINLNITFELDSIEMIKHNVKISNGVSILPSFSVNKDECERNSLVAINIMESQIESPATILCKKPGRHLIAPARKLIDKLAKTSFE